MRERNRRAADSDIPIDRRVLLSVGRLAAEKNTRTLCDAFRILASQRPGEYHLLITGEGMQRKLVEDLRNRHGRGDLVAVSFRC